MKKFKLLSFLFLKNPDAGFVGFWQAIRRKTLLDYRLFNNGFSFYPSTIVFHPTARCNLRCKMCVVSSYSFLKELKLGQIKRIIDQIAFFKPHFYIAGGEPLLRDDLEEIILYAKKKGLITTFTTNGTLLTSKRAEKIIQSRVDGISVSIDGPEEINDQIRGRGNFKKAVRTIEVFLKTREKCRQILPRLKIATVISGLSYQYLDQMVNMADELKVEEIVFFHMDYKGEKIARSHRNCLLANFKQQVGCLGYIVKNSDFTAINLAVLKKQIRKILYEKHKVSVSFAPPVPFAKISNYYNGKYFKNFACTNPWFSATILPNGDLVPCFSLKIGNLLENDFRELWNSNFYKKFRKYLKNQHHFPGCFRCCGTTDV